MKLSRLLSSCLLLTAAVPASAVVLVINGTMQTDTLGYSIGQEVNFTFELNDFAPTGPSGQVTAVPSYNWFDNFLSTDPELFTSVTGTGLSGTYTRPDNADAAPRSIINISNLSESYGDFAINFANDSYADSPAGLGLTVDGRNLKQIYLRAYFEGLNFDLSSGTLPDPTVYLADYEGTYSAFHLDGQILVDNNAGAFFAINSLSISSTPLVSVPEPAAIGALFGMLAMGWSLRRRRVSRDAKVNEDVRS